MKLVQKTAALLIGALLMAGPVWADGDTYEFDIEAQSVSGALKEFAEQTGLQVAYFSVVADGEKSKPIKGTLTADAALTQLLASTSLTYENIDDRTVTIIQANPTERDEAGEPGKSQPASQQILTAQVGTSAQQSRTTATSSTDSGAEKTEAGRNIIEEVLVTARKREESLQDVPISISAYSAADLEAMSLTSLKELGQFTPNFSFYDHAQFGRSSAIVFIRGVGQADPDIFFDPGVGIYVDGVYMGRSQGVDLDLVALERVEILRGPQGTLFGRNTIGGAVNVVTSKPTDEFSATAEITIGRYNRIDGKASINVPIVPGKLTASFAGATRNRDGYGKRLDFFSGKKIDDMGDINSLTGRALINWTPSDNLDVLLSVDGTRVREMGPVRKTTAFSQPPIIGLLNLFVDPDYGDTFLTDSKFTSFADGLNANDLDALGLGLTVDWNIGRWAVKSITSYRDMEAPNAADADGSIYTIIDADALFRQEQFSQELQVSSLAFEGRLNWVAGFFYFEENASSELIANVFRELNDFIGLDLSLTTNEWADAQSYAAFGQGTYTLTDKLSLTGGLRYTLDEKEVAREQLFHFSGLVRVPWDSRSESWDAVSGRAGFEYRWNDDIMTYASIARGFKSGGINGRSLSADDFVPFDPEFIWTYEVGLRSDLLDRRLRFNASLFYSDYNDIQFLVTSVSALAEPITIVDNAAKGRVKGFEVDVVAAPLPGLTLTAGVGLNDAEYTKVDPGSPITENSKFVKVPKWTVTLSGQYAAPIKDWGELIGRLDYVYKSKVYHDVIISPYNTQEGYGLLNARLTFESAGGNWSIAVFGTNLGDKRYIMAAIDRLGGLGFAEGQYARPREWGVSLTYRF